jgi:hypothetical protein
MVLFKAAVAGMLLLALGVVSVTLLNQYVTMEVQLTQRRDVEPHVELLIGDIVEKSYMLPTNVDVFGTVTVTQAPSNQSGDIRFIVMDNENYLKWSTSGQADSLYSVNGQGQFNYTFTTKKSGVFHFVFDNRASLYKKYVALTVAFNEVLSRRVPDTRLVPVGWILMVLGGLILIYGLARKPPIPWSRND